MQTPAEIKNDAQTFISVIFASMVVLMAYNLLSNIIRALGDSKTPLYFLIFATIVNVILELLFLLVFHWGIAGAGFATVLAQGVSVVLCIVYIVRKLPLLQIEWKDFKTITKESLGKHLYVGLHCNRFGAAPVGFKRSWNDCRRRFDGRRKNRSARNAAADVFWGCDGDVYGPKLWCQKIR